MDVTVARIGKAHGLKGEVSVELRTDIPEQRLVAGAAFATDPVEAGPLTVVRTRVQAGRWYVQFDEIRDRDAAEAARGVSLVVDADEDDEEDAWFVHELVGLTAVREDGAEIGRVVDLQPMPAQDLLVVKQPGGHRALIPFVADFVVEVDVEGGRVVLDPPHGLLAGEEPESTGETAGEG
ncbi:ribosome maturation factor RimM [Demequina zhanjiangensis]|uniref:Ribosome maturation factor RimM n=1 Tax=Demequina zhanjiangensis TaxID=3051659 RepID=A0ABT8G342_9MICO|nr:ribosome maturation factor RimM [Demequina sp. SYSU T00b26]MDN4473556.1 ribosome maturation factor RimM [Demequina sp. SYSU T00b26]